MSAAPFTPSEAAPESVRLYGVILGNLVGVAGRLLQRNPLTLVMALPLWVWLNRTVGRLERAIAREGSGRVRESRAGVPGRAARKLRFRFPTRWMWLRRMLGWEVAAFGSQLQHVLMQPEMQAAIASKPAVGRILRPVCRMLGVKDALKAAPEVPKVAPEVPKAAPGVRRVATAAPDAVAVAKVRKLRERAWEPGRNALRGTDVPWMVAPRKNRGLG